MTGWIGRLAIGAASVAVVLSIANAAARVTWHAVGVTAGSPLGQVATAATEAPKTAPDVELILAFAPFGKAVEEAEPESVVEETSLELVLHGVVLADAREDSIAYISGHRPTIEAYGVGDPIGSDVVLQEVLADRVVLDVAGRREVLSFPKRPEPGADLANVKAQMQAAAGGERVPAAGSTPDEVIDFWRRRIAQNPGAVLDQLGLEATEDGYRIGVGAHPGVRRAGFKEGDLVASVNGKKVGDVESDRRLYDDIAASGRARVELIRDGRTIVMSFPLR